MVTRLHSDANETEIRVCIAGDRDRRVGGCANEGEPRVKITPVGGYVTYVGDGSLHEHWKRANFVPGGNFHRANTHTHIRTHTRKRHTQGKEIYLCMDIYLYAQKRSSFLGRLGRVSFNDLCILGGRGEREGENEQGPSRDSQWKFPFRGDRCRGRLFSARRRRSDARRSIF